MNQIKALIEKEFRLFFNSAIGYVFLVVFLSFSGWMFFRTFFLIGQTDMRDFFLFLPWSLLFLIPAFTMRSWAEEFRSGTIESLFTSGIKPFKIIAGKLIAIILFLILALVLTLPFTFSVAFMGNLDWGVVLISYLGVFLLGVSYILIGLLVSAMTQNQIVSFLISLLFCFIFYILGESFITIFFPGFFGEILHSIGLGAHYKSMIRGVIDTRDILFYLSFITILLTANMAVLSGRFWPRKHYWRGIISLVLVIVFVTNLGGRFVFARFDGTENKNYTISNATKNILQNMEKPVVIKAFISKNIPAQVQTIARDVRDILDEYKARGGNNLSVEVLDPMTNDDSRKLAQNFGIPPLQLQVIERDQQQVVKAYLGIAIAYENQDAEEFADRFEKFETLPIVTNISDFEYQLTSAIKKTSSEKLPVIGFLTDHGTRTLSDLRDRFGKDEGEDVPIRDLLRKNYEVRDISFADEDFDEKLSELVTLIIIGPMENFSDDEATKIHKFLETKNVIFLADKINIVQNITQNSFTDFSNILSPFGLSAKPSLVADAINANVNFGSNFFTVSRPYPFWIKANNLSVDNAITRDLSSIIFPWISPIGIFKKEDVKVEILAKTSPYFIELASQELVDKPVESDDGAESDDSEIDKDVEPEKVMVDKMISLDPNQNFAFSRDKKDPANLAVIAQKGDGGKLLFIANTRMVLRKYIQDENIVFLNNAIDSFSSGDDLISIRSKQITDRPITMLSDSTKSMVRWINILLIPILVIFFGLSRRWLRNQRKILS